MDILKNDIIKIADFSKLQGIIPVIIQDFKTKEVRMLGFMNKQALKKTLLEGKVTYFSRKRQKLWTKGETSGNFQIVKKIQLDCDNDTILIQIEQINDTTCHTGNKTCFYQK